MALIANRPNSILDKKRKTAEPCQSATFSNPSTPQSKLTKLSSQTSLTSFPTQLRSNVPPAILIERHGHCKIPNKTTEEENPTQTTTATRTSNSDDEIDAIGESIEQLTASSHSPPLSPFPSCIPNPPPPPPKTNLFCPFIIRKPIGSGSYGDIFDAEHASTGEKVALKRIKFDDVRLDSVSMKRIVREIEFLHLCKHENIIKCRGVYIDHTKRSDRFQFPLIDIALEKKMIDLWHLSRSQISFTEDHIRHFAFQMFAGLEYLHSAGILHRDIKPSNLLINRNCSLTITDFNLSRVLNGQSGSMSPISLHCSTPSASSASSNVSRSHKSMSKKGNPTPEHYSAHVASRWYRDPQLILCGNEKSKYGFPIDIWSAGCVFAEMLWLAFPVEKRRALFPGTTCFPFSAQKHEDLTSPNDQLNLIFQVLGTPSEKDICMLENATFRNYLLNLPPQTGRSLATEMERPKNDPAIDLLQKCLHFNPANRLTVGEILDHPYFLSYRSRRLKNSQTLWKGEKLSPFAVDSFHEISSSLAVQLINSAVQQAGHEPVPGKGAL